MKSQKLLDALENVNEEYIEEAVSDSPNKKKPKFLTLAACMALVLICAAVAYGVGSKPSAKPEITDNYDYQVPVPSEMTADNASESKTENEVETDTSNIIEASETVTTKRTESSVIGNKIQSIAPRFAYNGNEYIICGSAGEGEILKNCGLPETLTAECAGKEICKIKTADGIVWTPDTDSVIYESEAAMYEYALYPTQNVYILYLDGTYYAAIRYENGYCSVYDN